MNKYLLYVKKEKKLNKKLVFLKILRIFVTKIILLKRRGILTNFYTLNSFIIKALGITF